MQSAYLTPWRMAPITFLPLVNYKKSFKNSTRSASFRRITLDSTWINWEPVSGILDRNVQIGPRSMQSTHALVGPTSFSHCHGKFNANSTAFRLSAHRERPERCVGIYIQFVSTHWLHPFCSDDLKDDVRVLKCTLKTSKYCLGWSHPWSEARQGSLRSYRAWAAQSRRNCH